MSDFKTYCCKSDIKRIGRAHYVCKKCGKDITIEWYFHERFKLGE